MGNNGRESKSYPAACDGVMAIGATDINDAKASFSQYGSWISVGAPGHNILSTIPGNKYAVYSGTSMATPYAAGLAALVKDTFPSLTANQIRERIEKSADDVGTAGFDKMFGHGRINAAAAVK
ncbi:Thermostable alkaline protease precursor [compost metagenome]